MGGWGAGHQENGPRSRWALLQRGDVIGTRVGLPARVGGRQARLGAAPGVGRSALSTGHRSRASSAESHLQVSWGKPRWGWV